MSKQNKNPKPEPVAPKPDPRLQEAVIKNKNKKMIS